MATGVRPDLRDIHAWGTKGYVRVEGRSKLEPQADPVFFVGYDHQSKGYRVLVNQAEPRDPIYPIPQNPAPPTPQDPVLPTGLQTRRAANAAVAFDSAAPWELGTSILDCCGAYWALNGRSG